MQGKVMLEEHFAIADTLEDSHGYFPDRVWQEVKARVMDIHERRLREMDQNGIDLMLLSLNAPAVQAIPDTAQYQVIAEPAKCIQPRGGDQQLFHEPAPDAIESPCTLSPADG